MNKQSLELFDMTQEELNNCMSVDDLKILRALILEMATDLIQLSPPEQSKKIGWMVRCVQEATKMIDNTIKLQDQVHAALTTADALKEASQSTKQ